MKVEGEQVDANVRGPVMNVSETVRLELGSRNSCAGEANPVRKRARPL
jgi:hypothetical protein